MSRSLFVARESDHGMLLRDPEPAMVDAIRTFIRRSAGRSMTTPTARPRVQNTRA
jgi:hypothetical protein